MQVGIAPISLGFVLAIIALVLDVVFAALGQVDLKVGVLIGILAVARLC